MLGPCGAWILEKSQRRLEGSLCTFYWISQYSQVSNYFCDRNNMSLHSLGGASTDQDIMFGARVSSRSAILGAGKKVLILQLGIQLVGERQDGSWGCKKYVRHDFLKRGGQTCFCWMPVKKKHVQKNQTKIRLMGANKTRSEKKNGTREKRGI